MVLEGLFDKKERLINLDKSISLFKSYDLVGTLSHSRDERLELLVGRFHLDDNLVKSLIFEIDQEIVQQFSNLSDEEKNETRKWIDYRLAEINQEMDNLSSIEEPYIRKKTIKELITRVEIFEDYQNKFSSRQR